MKIVLKNMSVLAGVSALGLMVSACNSPAEESAENSADNIEENADVVRDNADKAADNMENRADAVDTKLDGQDTATENAMENKAQTVRDKAADGK